MNLCSGKIGDGHRAVCFEGPLSDCPVCGLFRMLNHAEGQLDERDKKIAKLMRKIERLQKEART